MKPIHSLQLRLAVRLAIIYLTASTVTFGVLVYRGYDTASTLAERELSERAADLGKIVTLGAGGTAEVALPASLDSSYRAATGSDIFAIRGPDGRVLAAMPASFGDLVSRWPKASDDPSYFRLKDFGGDSRQYDGLSVAIESPAGLLSISVARTGDDRALAYSVLQEFLADIAWFIPILVLATLAVGVWVIRAGLRPVRQVSELAATIGPRSTSVRLPETDLPSEITPLVSAMNRALDRLEHGFAMQRQFTANAAHQLRTPLAIVTAALDEMNGNGDLEQLRRDVARMNRLIEQLLRVARLDAVPLDVSGAVDLNESAEGVVATLAPWAVGQGRAIAFVGAQKPSLVRGNDGAITDAIRNVVENAVLHSPRGAEIIVTVGRDGCVFIADRGPGIPKNDLNHIFERFWRGREATSQGAGLGLAIVSEIMKAHQGFIGIDENPGGGTIFTLTFLGAEAKQPPDFAKSYDA